MHFTQRKLRYVSKERNYETGPIMLWTFRIMQQDLDKHPHRADDRASFHLGESPERGRSAVHRKKRNERTHFALANIKRCSVYVSPEEVVIRVIRHKYGSSILTADINCCRALIDIRFFPAAFPWIGDFLRERVSVRRCCFIERALLSYCIV